ncbi:DNA polymerase III subunit delta' C-terminal domain-containing protein, partial [Tessaracoccus lubricantis]
RAAQGHVGRARMLARSEHARIRRHEILTLPGRLTSVSACLTAAENLVAAAKEEAEQTTSELDAKEMAALQEALGIGGRGTAKPRNAQAAIRDLEEQQKMRAKRLQRDSLDRVLTELTGYYRDVLAAQTAPDVPLVNADLADEIAPVAQRSTPEQTVRALDAILAARTALEGNVAPLLALESMLISLSLARRS